MEIQERTAKETATIIEKIVTDVNTKYKQNRNDYRDNQDSLSSYKERKELLSDNNLSDDEREVIKLKEKKRADSLRKKINQFKIERTNYIMELCVENDISCNHIIQLGGFNNY